MAPAAALTVIARRFYNPSRMSHTLNAWMLPVGLAASLLLSGCQSRGLNYLPTEKQRVEMLSLMLPYELTIQPFTKIKSFNDDEIPDGLLAVIRPLDRFGDPVKAVGGFQFELWTYQPASGERKGERLAFWERTIATAEDVRLYWNRAQMYEFQLAWVQGMEDLRPGRKYVLTATYRTPWDEAIQDEYLIDFHLPSGVLTNAATESSTDQ